MKTVEHLRREYAQQVVDSMDIDSLMDFVFEQIMTNLEDYSDEQLKTEILEYAPNLLDNEDE